MGQVVYFKPIQIAEGWFDFHRRNHMRFLHHCVVWPTTDPKEALEMSALFCRIVMPDPSCVCWDGRHVIMLCDYAGRHAPALREMAMNLRPSTDPNTLDQLGPLWPPGVIVNDEQLEATRAAAEVAANEPADPEESGADDTADS